jgi:DNA-binding HxlR family transcriptional regulator
MRSYKQRCGLAMALDVIGDRWTLLIVRELMIRGACRYTDLAAGLPGIASNLLATRLRELEQAGVLRRDEAPPPIATSLFELTERGRALEPAILEVGRWGSPLLAQATRDTPLQPHWLVLPLRLYLVDSEPQGKDLRIEIRAGAESIVIEARRGSIDVRLGAAADPHVVVSGTPENILQLFSGRIGLPAALRAGVKWQGAKEALTRVLPPRDLRPPSSRAAMRPRAVDVDAASR